MKLRLDLSYRAPHMGWIDGLDYFSVMELTEPEVENIIEYLNKAAKDFAKRNGG